MHTNSRLAFTEHAARYFRDGDRVLEIAADGRPSTYQRHLSGQYEWKTADLASEVTAWNDVSHVDYEMPTEYEVPAPDGAFDVVLSGNVMEHVRRPWEWMQEMARVTRPGGLVITIAPISWPYHEAPIDCWRAYPEGLRALLEYSGLLVEHLWSGSLEARPSRRTFPGTGDVDDRNGLRWRMRRIVGWPTSIAYDVVGVARKPS